MIKGLKGIAAFIGFSEDATQRLLDRKEIPAFRIGQRWPMRRSTYMAMIEAREGL
ncbi:MAG: hypothetical protein JWL84_3562 [Rhodospirillales bacterium]|jgi:hypothetical protein|nr:hypothetical protein [Rhodospirillales bacterium]